MRVNEIITEASLQTNLSDYDLERMTRQELSKLAKQADDFGANAFLARVQAAMAKKPARAPQQAGLSAQQIVMAIDDAIGNTFPDGDPIDTLYPRFTTDQLDRAVRATKSGRDYHSYVKQVWQQHLDDNPEYGTDNPWN